ncbi:hypothetical protein [Ornithinimicrobium sp. INDO-MA30-4]|uniref:hypothetical protein n=1 Tax=Ornithinimicrobium sp. INDO-MA30-4 TaxID=2908651 RepID=UPI001F25C10F|nr:hypothetical protein [Ornithinimicrobium sp. INDO-MA30-4]UJH69589.1 hypothetical protein L0A91_09470 [Ornithinimicrobium sp. INDO-MA30-4]
MSKITMAAAFGAGYIFGSKAGRQRYEELKAKAEELWSNPKVQEQAAKVSEQAKDRMPGLSNDSGEGSTADDSEVPSVATYGDTSLDDPDKMEHYRG